nr:hypothetical protein [Tanacetum cinerariifolium]
MSPRGPIYSIHYVTRHHSPPLPPTTPLPPLPTLYTTTPPPPLSHHSHPYTPLPPPNTTPTIYTTTAARHPTTATTPGRLLGDDEAEEVAEKEAGGSASAYRDMSRGDWPACQDLWMYQMDNHWGQYLSTRDNLEPHLQIDPFPGREVDYPPYGYRGHMPPGYEKDSIQRIIEIDLFYLYCIYTPVVVCNIPYWLTKYLKGVREKNVIGGGMFVTRIARPNRLLTSEMMDAFSVEPRPYIFKNKSLIAIGIIMELHGEACYSARETRS